MMTEKEAWLYIAANIRRGCAKPNGEFWFPMAAHKDSITRGLCAAIISFACGRVRENMLRKIQSYARMHGNGYAYVWPTDEHGAKQRIEFCERMAAECIE